VTMNDTWYPPPPSPMKSFDAPTLACDPTSPMSHQSIAVEMSLLPGRCRRPLRSTVFFTCLLIHCPMSTCFMLFDKKCARNSINPGHFALRVSSSRLIDARVSLRSTAVGLQGNDATYDERNQPDVYHPAPQSFLSAIEPGSSVCIQIGDMSLARKAWKKRRRNKSPLLVPCSLLTKDLHSSLQDNILYLVKKFGSPRLSLSELLRRQRTHLLTPMSNQTIDAVYSSLKDDCESTGASLDENPLLQLLLILFPPGNAHGLEVIQRGEPERWFVQLRGVSHTKARRQAAAAAVVQFRDVPSSLCEGRLCLEHTGLVRTKSDGKYKLQPLSAALRIPNHQNGELLAGMGNDNDGVVSAFVWDFDERGDAGSPMIVLSLQPPLP
jgi:hypothetical protein